MQKMIYHRSFYEYANNLELSLREASEHGLLMMSLGGKSLHYNDDVKTIHKSSRKLSYSEIWMMPEFHQNFLPRMVTENS